MKIKPTASCSICNCAQLQAEPSFSTAGKSAAIGLMSAGSTYEQGKKIFNVMGIKFPDRNTFDCNIINLHDELKAILHVVMAENRALERTLVLARQ
jgi:hypothetical protein